MVCSYSGHAGFLETAQAGDFQPPPLGVHRVGGAGGGDQVGGLVSAPQIWHQARMSAVGRRRA